MDLWIRSQNKGSLIKVEMLGNTDGIIHSYLGVNKTILGEYKSSERALEVLDEIQKLLQPQTIINYESKLEFHPEYIVQNLVKTIPKTEIKELSTYVYEMPED